MKAALYTVSLLPLTSAFLLHFKQYVGQLRRDVEEDAARAVVLVGRDRLRRLVCARRDALKHLVLAFESLRESEVAFELVESVAHRVHVVNKPCLRPARRVRRLALRARQLQVLREPTVEV